jgi:hypothetical protein
MHNGLVTTMSEPPLTLRQVVDLLQGSIPKLHNLLKAGELKAGFQFVGVHRIYWIPISQSYWADVNSRKFRTLRYKSESKVMIGMYQVRISDFVDDFIHVVSQGTTGISGQALDEVKRALFTARKRYEVEITNDAWSSYMEQHPTASPVQRQSNAGHPGKTSWHHLVPIIAGYMMNLSKEEDHSQKHEAIAAMILQIASGENIRELPSIHTLRSRISEVFKRSEKFSVLDRSK